jgi:hypothetical protein
MRGDKKLLGVVAVRQFLSKDKREYFDFSVPFKGDHIVYLECEKTFPFECKLGQSLQLRGLSSFERDLYKIIKIFSHPPEWWLVQPGFQSMLYFLGIKEMPSKTSAQYSSVNVPSV